MYDNLSTHLLVILENMITWWAWPTHNILISCVSPLNRSWFTAESCSDYRNPLSARQDFISYYPSPLFYLANLGNMLTYKSWISLPRYNHYCFLHLRFHWVCDWNIQSCLFWWHHPWLWYSWHSPFQFPWATRFLLMRYSSCVSQNLPQNYSSP